MESTSELDMAALRRRLEAASAPDRAELMSAYLRNQFPFLGIGAKDRRAATRPPPDRPWWPPKPPQPTN
ncbi:MAG: DNA alkylation repair protein [Candidatus Microthrix sp.]|nr:DNA alkylation repair protein [Candidatus Microthrix sp.]